MNRFVVAIFPDLSSAKEGIRALKDLAFERTIQLHGAGTVTKGDGERLTMEVITDDGPAIAATGALIGGLAGLAIGPLAAAVLATGGAVFGASAGLTSRGAGMAFAEKVTRDLPHDRTALVAEVTTDDIATLVAGLEAVGGTVTRQEEVLDR